MSGPPLGGFIISAIGWRWIFFVNIPVGLLGIYFTIKYISDFPIVDPNRKTSLPGAMSLSIGLLAMILALLLYSKGTISLIPMLGLVAVSILAWLLFFYFESRPDTRLIGLDIFKNRVFSVSGSSMLLVFIALSSVTILMPFYLEQIKQLKPHQVGLYLTVIPVSIFIMAPLAGYLSDKVQARYISTVGIIIMCIGFIMIHRLGPEATMTQIVVVLALIGLGMGTFSTPNTSSIMGAVRQTQLGSASGILSTIRTLGMSLGVGVTIALFEVFRDRLASGDTDESARFVFGLQSVYNIMIFVIVAAGIVSFVRGKNLKDA